MSSFKPEPREIYAKQIFSSQLDMTDRITILEMENKRLMRIIDKEFNENDELGMEYTHIVILKEKISKLEENLNEMSKNCISLGLHESRVQSLERELAQLRGDRDKFLATDDCFYWTPEAKTERDYLRAKLQLAIEALEHVSSYSGYNEPELARLVLLKIKEMK